jgi:hypothetical protein
MGRSKKTQETINPVNYDDLVNKVRDYGVMLSHEKLDETIYKIHHEWYSVAYTDDMKRMIVVIDTGKRHDPFKEESFV